MNVTRSVIGVEIPQVIIVIEQFLEHFLLVNDSEIALRLYLSQDIRMPFLSKIYHVLVLNFKAVLPLDKQVQDQLVFERDTAFPNVVTQELVVLVPFFEFFFIDDSP